ncbi:M64 family metallopeptidase [Paucibacter sp. O1-1]|nr:M64 family metallopeptidase [Paucibacter sp. O1-1]MDA3830006.1 M64 family metallopeptidase [Paucibacter sp. O1-1]
MHAVANTVEQGNPKPTGARSSSGAPSCARKSARKAKWALFGEQLATEKKLFAREKHKEYVGAFEGAGYRAKGYYRSEVNCMMFSRVDFCAACRRAIERVIRMYSPSTAA